MELTTYYPVKWFDYELNAGEETIRLKLRYCPPALYAEMEKECTSFKMAGKSGNKRRKAVVDQMKLAPKLINHMLVDWEGLTFNGDSECTSEARLFLITNEATNDIAVWIAIQARLQGNFNNVESILKNLERSSEQNDNGSSPMEETNLKSIAESA